jgi:plastocyanin
MKMYTRFCIVSTLAASLLSASAGDITGKVTLDGTAPPEIVNDHIKNDPICGPMHPEEVTTHFYVVGPNHELGDVVVMLDGISGKSTGASAPPQVLDQKGCLYSPTIFAIQTGQKVLVRNSDPVLHNVHVVPGPGSQNPEMNKAQMQGGADIEFSFDHPEKFLKFKCDVHDWMFAWAVVVDHPYFAVTAPDGTFKISNVPPGKYTIEAAHRKCGSVTKDIVVTDSPVSVDFTLEAPKPK